MFHEEGYEEAFFLKLYLCQIRLEWVENPILNKQTNTCLKPFSRRAMTEQDAQKIWETVISD